MINDVALKVDGRNEIDPTVEQLREMYLYFLLERFYYNEAALLDERRYEDWLELFTKDVKYWMPIRRTQTGNKLSEEFTKEGDMAFFDDDYSMLNIRIKKLATGYAWSEDPPSRQRHIITNIRVISDTLDFLLVESNFHFYRTRLNSEEDTWIGHRKDKIRRIEGGFKIARREIYLEQTVLLSRNLSNFF